MEEVEVIEVPDESIISKAADEIIEISSDIKNEDLICDGISSKEQAIKNKKENGNNGKLFVESSPFSSPKQKITSIQTPSSPIITTTIHRKSHNLSPSTSRLADDSIVDSTFSFARTKPAQEGQVSVQENSSIPSPESKLHATSPKSNAINKSYEGNLLDLANWISESEDDSGISRFIGSIPTLGEGSESSNKRIKTTTANENVANVLSLHNGASSKAAHMNSGFQLDMSDPICEVFSSPLRNLDAQETVDRTTLNLLSKTSTPLAARICSKLSNKSSIETIQLRTKRTERRLESISKRSSANTISNCKLPYSQRELKEANKVSRKKEELLAEMVIYIPKSLYEQNFQKEYMEQVFIHTEVQLLSSELPLISWKRKINAKYDSNSDIFIPCPPTQIKEKNLVLYYKASELINKIKDGSIKSTVKNCISVENNEISNLEYNVIIMVEGFDQFLNRLRNVENKKYKTAVLSKLKPNESESSIRKRRKEPEEEIDISAKDVEYMVNDTQLKLGVNIFPVKTNQEAIDWLYSFTYTISFALYDKFERNNSLANLGTVRSGSDTKSTFLQTLRQFKLMTEPKAERLYGFYGSICSIYSRYQYSNSLGTDSAGRNLIPPTTDRAMKKLFTSDDPNDVIHE